MSVNASHVRTYVQRDCEGTAEKITLVAVKLRVVASCPKGTAVTLSTLSTKYDRPAWGRRQTDRQTNKKRHSRVQPDRLVDAQGLNRCSKQ